MKFKSDQTYDKLRGGYYTPAPVAVFLTRWALGAGASSLLEPSCGDGAFLDAALKYSKPPRVIHGVELDPAEAAKAQARLGRPSADRRIFPMDYLKFGDVAPRGAYEAVVGNPPYIRYQFLASETQGLAKMLYERHGLPFTKHLNAWAPFVVDSLDRLVPGGRQAMIIPAELMNVIHSGGLRRFLLEQCSKVLVIDPQTLIFNGSLQGTVLLLAEKRRRGENHPCGLAITHEVDNNFLVADPETVFRSALFVDREPSDDKWMDSLLTVEERDVLGRITRLPDVHEFRDIAHVEVGIVTGANKFFLVSDSTVCEYDLQEFARPMFGRSFHCQGVIYDEGLHAENGAAGLATNFLQFGAVPFNELPSGARRYVEKGEAEDTHQRYKCRIREPWYDVPSIRSSKLSLLKRCHELPRVISNELGALTTDTAYRVDSNFPSSSIAVSFVNSLTALSAELRGRSYGGGVLELVPSEIRSLLVPLVEASAQDLSNLNARLHGGESVEAILESQDNRVLSSVGLTSDEIGTIQAARMRLRNRRLREVEAA